MDVTEQQLRTDKIQDMRDRISDLPEDIRKEILSSMATRDAMLTSILSKTWRYDWLSLPYLDFGQGFFRKRWNCRLEYECIPDPEETLRFLEFLDRAVIRHKATIQKLRLYLPPLDQLSSKIASCLDGLMVDELDVDVIGTSYISPLCRSCYIPKCLLTSKSITKLYIQGCNLSSTSISTINLPALRELSLKYVVTSQQVVENLISNCAAVEKLCFARCEGFQSLRVSGLENLILLEQKYNKQLERFEINSAHLRSLCHLVDRGIHCDLVMLDSCQILTDLELSGDTVLLSSAIKNISVWGTLLETLSISSCNVYEGLNIHTCQKLSKLRLSSCSITSDWLNWHLSQLECLEALDVTFCSGSEHLKIFSNHLRSLTIRCRSELEHVEINCPNLHYFSFGTKGRIIRLSSKTMFAPACARLQFLLNGTGDSKWDGNFIELLKALRLSKCLAIDTEFIENVIIPRRVRLSYWPPLCVFEQVNIFPRGSVSCLDVTRCIEALLWACPELKALHIMDERLSPSPPYGNISVRARGTMSLLKLSLKFKYKEPFELDKKGCGCYTHQAINCGRHSLKNFEIIEQQGFEDDDGSLRRYLESAMMGK